MYIYFQDREQIRFDFIKENTKPKVSMGNEKKRSLVNDRPRVKRIKTIKQQTQPVQPSIQLDVKPPMQSDKLQDIIKQEPIESGNNSIPFIKEEILENVPSPPPVPSPSSPLQSPPTSVPIPDLIEEELIKTNLNAIKLENCSPINNDIVKMEEEILQDQSIKLEPKCLTADEIRKAEEGQVAAAMLLEQMSDIEEKYNPPLTPSPPPPLPSPPMTENISGSQFSPPDYHIKREFHPEDMLTSTAVQSIKAE